MAGRSPTTRCTNGSAMPTTRCADAASGISVFGDLTALPDAARDLFCGNAWYETVLACGMAVGAAPRFVVCDGAVVLLPMQVLAGGRDLASLTTLYTCRYQPLCDPGAGQPALTAAFAAFAAYCRAWPTVRLDALDADAPWLPALRAAAASAGLASRQFAHFGNWHERVAGLDWARYLAARQGQLRETIRRRLARAGREGGRFELVTGGDALEPGIAAYETVYARSWKPAEPFPRFNAALMRATA